MGFGTIGGSGATTGYKEVRIERTLDGTAGNGAIGNVDLWNIPLRNTMIHEIILIAKSWVWVSPTGPNITFVINTITPITLTDNAGDVLGNFRNEYNCIAVETGADNQPLQMQIADDDLHGEIIVIVKYIENL
jgi:hypothetical protein